MQGNAATDIDTAIRLAREHSWVPLAAVVVGIFVRLAKDDRVVRWFPLAIPPRWRAIIALSLGLTAGVLEALRGGDTWGSAIVGGVMAGVLPIAGHEIVVQGLRGGRDIGQPKATGPGSTPPPPMGPPISIKPPAMPVVPPTPTIIDATPLTPRDRPVQKIVAGVALTDPFRVGG